MARPTQEQLEAFWDVADKDGNGFMDINEFKKVVMDCQANGDPAPSNNMLTEMISSMDDNNDQKISKAEYIDHVTRKSNTKDNLEEAFKQVDTDGNGFVTVEELKKFLVDNNIDTDNIDDILKGSDENEDGKICFKEFLKEF